MTGSDDQKEAGTGFYSGAASSDTSYGVSDPGEQMAASALQLQGQSPEDIAALRTQIEREMLTMASGPQQLTVAEMERFFPQAPDLARQVGERAMVQSGRDPNESESERDARVAREQAEAQRAAMAMMGGAGLALAAAGSDGPGTSEQTQEAGLGARLRGGLNSAMASIGNAIGSAKDSVASLSDRLLDRSNPAITDYRDFGKGTTNIDAMQAEATSQYVVASMGKQRGIDGPALG